MEAAAQAAWRTGRDQVPQLRPVMPHESLVWMRVQEAAVGGEPVGAHPPLPHAPLLAHHLERNIQVLVTRTTISTKGPELSKPYGVDHPLDNHPKGIRHRIIFALCGNCIKVSQALPWASKLQIQAK